MFINDIPISEYGAKLLSRKISSAEIDIKTFWPRNAMRPYIGKNPKYYYKNLELEIEFQGSANEIEINKSRLIKALTSASVAFKALEHIYTGTIDKTSSGTQEYGFEVLRVDMVVFEHEEMQSISISSQSSTIYLESNEITPAVIYLLPSADIPSLTLEGLGESIEIKNLTSGIEVIINGEDGSVTQAGENKWLDYDSWSFPKLMPGENEITISSPSATLRVEFSPRWV